MIQMKIDMITNTVDMGSTDIEYGRSGGYSGNYYPSTNGVSSKKAQKEKKALKAA